MCKILKVDISSYYHWINNGCIVKTVDDKLNELIEIIFIQSRCKYGTRCKNHSQKDTIAVNKKTPYHFLSGHF